MYTLSEIYSQGLHCPDALHSLRQWLSHIEINNPRMAHLIVSLIPARCPFARQFKLFNRAVMTLPPLCHLNPFYDQLMELRFKALVYLEN